MGTKRSGVVWPNAEEHLIAELVRRPNLNDELNELRDYKKRNPKYFPRSIEKLLYGWDKTLDESRQTVEPTNPSDGDDRFFKDIGPEQVKRFKQMSPKDQNSWRTNWEMNHG